MSRRFNDQQCLDILATLLTTDTDAASLAHQLGCSLATIWAAVERAYVLQPPVIAEPDPTPHPHCHHCRGVCHNVIACGRRDRAAQQRRGGLLKKL